MLSDPLCIFGSIGIMAFVCLFFLTMMNEGLPERLPVGVVDHDNSSISRMVKRELDAGQAIEIVSEYGSYTEARKALQRGEIYAFVEMPDGMYDDLLAYKRPTITIYANQAYTLGATLAYKQILTMANLASGAVQREVMRGRGYRDDQIMPIVQPIVIDTHILSNPWVNYSVYLSTTIIPGILGLVVIMFTAFSIIGEMKRNKARRWLATANDDINAALAGKLLPYTILFSVLGWTCNILMYKVLHFPMEGSFWFLNVAMVAYVIAVQCVAVFIVCWLPMPGLSISLCALYGTLSLTLSGFSYPYEAMLPPFKALTWLVPLRHYYTILVDQMLMGVPVTNSLFRLAVLLAAVIAVLPITHRLKNAITDPHYIGD